MQICADGVLLNRCVVDFLKVCELYCHSRWFVDLTRLVTQFMDFQKSGGATIQQLAVGADLRYLVPSSRIPLKRDFIILLLHYTDFRK